MTASIDKVLLRFADSLRYASPLRIAESRHLADSLHLSFDIDIALDENLILEDLSYGRDDGEAEPTPEAARRALELS